ETARPDLEGSYVAPRSQTEELLATDIFASVLGVTEVGVNDTFFDLGGNSLQATQLVSRIRDTFGAQVGLRDFYTAPTVADLARLLKETGGRQADGEQGGRPDGDGAAPASDGSRPVPGRRPDPLPLSYNQGQLWFLDQLLPGQSTYNIPQAMRLTGDLDVE